MPINSFLYPGAKVTTGYDVDNSLRFDDGSSDYLNKTFSAQNRRTWTYSVWIKRAKLSSTVNLFRWNTNDADRATFQINSSDKLLIQFISGGSFQYNSDATARVFRDTSAWYHLVLAVDTTDATQADRVKLYVNGVQETLSPSTNISQNTDTNVNTGLCQIGGDRDTGTPYAYYDGYMAEAVFVDGQQLLPTSFGEFDEDSPSIWKPKDVSGLTFGTNGFYLDFENASSLGADVSGNSNNFTVNNLTSIDQTTDTCTNNFATLNSLSSRSNNGTFSEGNTKFVGTMDGDWTVGTIAATAGKWYWEVKANEANYLMLGITTTDIINDNPTGSLSGDGFMGFRNTDNFYNFGTLVTNSYSYSDNDIFSFMLDLDAGDCEFYQNDTLKQTITLPTDKGDTWIPIIGDTYDVTDGNYNINFGNPSVAISSGNTDPNGYGNFEYATKSGYAWNTKNLAEFG